MPLSCFMTFWFCFYLGIDIWHDFSILISCWFICLSEQKWNCAVAYLLTTFLRPYLISRAREPHSWSKSVFHNNSVASVVSFCDYSSNATVAHVYWPSRSSIGSYCVDSVQRRGKVWYDTRCDSGFQMCLCHFWPVPVTDPNSHAS